jgi:CO/xanthine dehydrogenase Mo-binding subunit
MTVSAALTLPSGLADNPRLDQWVAFPGPRQVTVRTGKVEIGQGVLTALRQIAAEELDIAPERISLQSGDTELTPNEGYTSGSQSIQVGGVALRLACAEVRLLILEHAAAAFNLALEELAVRDGVITRLGQPTTHDYWSIAGSVDLSRQATGRAALKAVADYTVVGRNAPRVDLAAKLSGETVFIHDLAVEGALHARVIRQPCRNASIASIDEAAIRRGARGPVDLVRHGNFLAVVAPDETVAETVAATAASHVVWHGVEPITPQQEAAGWLLQRPSIDRVIGPEPTGPSPGLTSVEATYSRGYVAHASVAPSCAVAVFRDGKLRVWTHSQGVYPLKAALSRMLKLDPGAIAVTHMQGPGCYGHNGADDAAADAAVIAVRMPGKPIRVRWRREEEFAFEPVSSSMVVTAHAVLDASGRPADWTTEIWSGTHSGRPGRDGQLLAEQALPDPPPPPEPSDVPEARGGGGTRNADPLYDFATKRIIHHLIPDMPVRTSSLRGLGATANVFAIESFIDELAERAGADSVAYRLSLLSDQRARQVIERVAAMCDWRAGAPVGTGQAKGIAFARYKNRAAYAAVVVEVNVDEEIKLARAWCAADAGLVINPDGAINQLEGGIIQAASWTLKEQVRLQETGIRSRDWESYPVLRFSEIPEVSVELVNPTADLPSLGVGEASGGPTAAAIGNAAARALGTRLRDLPMTRERVMAALLTG